MTRHILLGSIKNLLLMAIAAAYLASCGVSSRTTTSELSPMDMISAHSMIGDTDGLFDDLIKFPEYARVIDSIIINKVTLSDSSYNKLVEYAALATNDLTLTQHIGKQIIGIQSMVLKNVSDMSIEELSAFYRARSADFPFLSDVIRKTYLNDLDNLDYSSLKKLFTAFDGTDLGVIVAPIYKDTRSSLLNIINEELDMFFEQEESALNAVEYNIRCETEQYIETGVNRIIPKLEEKLDRGLFKRIFKHEDKDDYTFLEYTAQLISQNLNSEVISSQIQRECLDFINTSRKMREEYLSQILDDFETYQNYYIADTIVTKHPLEMIISTDDASQIQGMKTMGSILSVASIALMFTPAGWVGAAVDAVDFLHGMSEPSRQEKMLESLASNLYIGTTESIDEYLTKLFGNLLLTKQATENAIKERINEDF